MKNNILGNKLRPAIRLIKNLDRREFDQLIQGMELLYEGIQEFKSPKDYDDNPSKDYDDNPYAIKVSSDDIDEADEALTQEMKKTKKSKRQKN